MAERFQRVFLMDDVLYADECPIIIVAGALQKDTVSGKILAQLKMRNIGEDKISSCKVSIKAFENNGHEIEGVKNFSYLDLQVTPGEDFGSKTPIYLPNNTTRSFYASVDEIVFADKTVKEIGPVEWKSVPNQTSINEVLEDPEIIKQYGLEVKGDCKYVPEKRESLFLCTCGAINNVTNKKCYKCGRSYEEQIQAFDFSNLKEKTEMRLEVEKTKKEEALEEALIEKEKSRKKIKKIITAIVTLIMVFAIFGTVNVIHKKNEAKKEAERQAEINRMEASCDSLYGHAYRCEDGDRKGIVYDFNQPSIVTVEYNGARHWLDYQVKVISDSEIALDTRASESALFSDGEYQYIITGIDGTQITEFTSIDGSERFVKIR